jgi:hypothetical protein
MSGLGGLQVLDVAIGLAALFFLLSTALSAINEGIANVLGWRAKTLEDGLRRLVSDTQVKDGVRSWFGRIDKNSGDDPVLITLWDHWRMKALVRNPDSNLRRRARPSYVPPRAFSLALAETLAASANESDPTKPSPWEQADKDILDGVLAAADGLPEGQLKNVVMKASINAHKTLDGFRAQVEHLFNDSMERASGWYKRKVQTMLLVLATVVVIGLNIDTVHVTTSLLNDAPLRQAVAARASDAGTPEDAAAAIDKIEELKLPVGWGANAPDNVFAAIPGWLIAIAALNLGAPFWFDLLSRFSRLRGSGLQERPRALSDTVAVERERKAIAGSEAAEPAAESEPEPAEPAAETEPESAEPDGGETEPEPGAEPPPSDPEAA